MSKLLDHYERSHYCGDLRLEHVGQEVVVMGWVQHRRDHGGCIFIDLRDRQGLVQVVFDQENDAQVHQAAEALRAEYVLACVGKVRQRLSPANRQLPTGEIEVVAVKLEIFSQAVTPPFAIGQTHKTNNEVGEEVRLRHRVLDLRQPRLQAYLRCRHQLNGLARQVLVEQGFWELETPYLIRSTPEGARDYVVPSRVHKGKFFALPQSPQLFKQLLMIGGFDRYFQIARCFRDEDLRAERQPEFSQIDLEMSFCTAKDIMRVTEDIVRKIFAELSTTPLPVHIPKITYAEAINRTGSDAPDLRFGLQLVDVSQAAAKSSLTVFTEVLKAKGCVKGINIGSLGEMSRSQLDSLSQTVKDSGGKGLAWIKVKSDGSWMSPIAKFIPTAARDELTIQLMLKPQDTAIFVADHADVVHQALSTVRKQLAKDHQLTRNSAPCWLWVVDFPLFTKDRHNGRLTAAHHPFTAPQMQDLALLDSAPEQVTAQAYDLVLNGVEMGGGSIRIHDPELQTRLLTLLGMTFKQIQEQFGFLIEALRYGAPPHGGIALGIDRLCMQLCQTSSIRDVIAFPKTQRQQDLLLNAPSSLSAEQLRECHLSIL